MPSELNMPFSTEIEIRFGDTDPAGIVYSPVIFHYLHIALEEFFTARCGTSYADLVQRERLGFPSVNVRAEFLRPLVYGDRARVQVALVRLGRSSLALSYTIERASDRQTAVHAEVVHVCMDLDARRAVPIPDRYRAALEKEP